MALITFLSAERGMRPVESRFDSTVPLNRTGSCGMIVRAWRSLLLGIFVISRPSYKIVPEMMCVNLRRERINYWSMGVRGR